MVGRAELLLRVAHGVDRLASILHHFVDGFSHLIFGSEPVASQVLEVGGPVIGVDLAADIRSCLDESLDLIF